jgi:hypothetical protein
VDNADPESKPLLSWRAQLTHVFNGNQRVDFQSPWDSPTNSALAGPCYVFCQPEGRKTTGETCFLAITGPGTAFGDGTSPPLAITKIPGDTILIVETRHSGLHWMQPGDFDIRTMPRTINAADGTGIGGAFRDDFLVGFADASYWRLSPQTPFETLARFFTVADAESNDREELLGPYRVQ